jgi:hypothetical protein
MYSLLDRFQGGLWGMTIGHDLIAQDLEDPDLAAYLDYIPQVMVGHVSIVELLRSLSAGTFSPMDWSFYGTLSLAMAGELRPTIQSFTNWSEKKVTLHEEALTWAIGSIETRLSLVSVVTTSKQLFLDPREASIALAIYGGLSLPGNWDLVFNRIVKVSPMPSLTASLLGCLLGAQGTSRAIPAELRRRYESQGLSQRSQAERLVRSWSGSVTGAIVTSPRRIHLG